jgi:hypothetical protein
MIEAGVYIKIKGLRWKLNQEVTILESCLHGGGSTVYSYGL